MDNLSDVREVACQFGQQVKEKAATGFEKAKDLWTNREDPSVQQTFADHARYGLRIATVATAVIFAWQYMAVAAVAGVIVATQLKEFESLAGYVEQFNEFFDDLREKTSDPTTQILVDTVVFLTSWTMPALTATAIGLRLGTELNQRLDSWAAAE